MRSDTWKLYGTDRSTREIVDKDEAAGFTVTLACQSLKQQRHLELTVYEVYAPQCSIGLKVSFL